ncbi:unnamed protein product [Alternaria alternata]|uniref:NDT80 domain-containing protein n=1 Tax=Alternaria tenuissima TaxID=119927 RepID=A0ABY0G0S0_9PLEO|nr:hypothetical protein B0T12DRAFT_503488 [Alternaria alternata]RYN65627.1 hypothetical protein AA0118_g2962 [Alternaria tenuissima]RYN84944.1 hypothetical protein AA0120_g9190 [Alternaria tenuissima]RYN91374.1 hypothetical protein AA0119_g10469 [Alternaria tenuissima]RYO15197.1 hypothetical protein AA0121_g7153 [Alternaria tenuissima]
MRYDDWDVILFPKDSHVPIQEFKTACYVSPEEYGRQLPTLTCYINSLPTSTPFRISVHSWATLSKASPLIESRRKTNQKVVYTVQVIVDGARVFRGFFDITSKWPQEIAHEKRSLTTNDYPTSQQKPYLEFPPFHHRTLMQSSWDARDPNGRIRITLSEQLITKSTSPGEADVGATNDIVCFSFQHAPKDILEQTGISWPIRNPLYLPNGLERATYLSQTSPTLSWAPKVRPFIGDMQMQSPISQRSMYNVDRPPNILPNRRSNAHLPSISQFSKPVPSLKNNSRLGTWGDTLNSLGGCADDVSMDTWSTKRTTSGSTSDMAMPDCSYTSSHLSRQGLPPWMPDKSQYNQSNSTDWENHHPGKDKERQLVVTLRDDQLGQIIEAMSPPKQNRELQHGFCSQHHENAGRPPTAHTYHPSKPEIVPPVNRPSSASIVRKSSYAELNNVLRNASNKQSPTKQRSQDKANDKPSTLNHLSVSTNKENYPPSQSRLPTPFLHANRVPTPNPFAQRLPTYTSDVSMRDPSIALSSIYRFNRSEAPPLTTEPAKFGSAHGPSTVNIRGRKEGFTSSLPRLSDQVMRHDQSSPPSPNSGSQAVHTFASKGQDIPLHDTQNGIPDLVEVIDVDAIDAHLATNTALDSTKLSPFKPCHKTGVSLSSIDSTGRLERQLFSALGEELGSFEHHIDNTGMGPELTQAIGGGMAHSDVSGTVMLNPTASDFEPTIKRKRQVTLSHGDRERSPMTKKEKAELVGAEGQDEEEVVVCLRGD